VPGQPWDLKVATDDATKDLFSGFFLEEETMTNFQGFGGSHPG